MVLHFTKVMLARQADEEELLKLKTDPPVFLREMLSKTVCDTEMVPLERMSWEEESVMLEIFELWMETVPPLLLIRGESSCRLDEVP